MNRERKEAGFSLIEVVVASGVMMSVVLGAVTFMEFQANQNASLRDSMAILDLHRTLNDTLMNSSQCSPNFANQTLAKLSSSGIKQLVSYDASLNPGSKLIQVGDAVAPGSPQSVASISFSNVQTISPNAQIATLKVNFAKNGGPSNLAPIAVSNIVFVVNPSDGNITGCGLNALSVLQNSATSLTQAMSTNQSCPSGQFVNGLNLDGSLVCGTSMLASNTSPTTDSSTTSPTLNINLNSSPGTPLMPTLNVPIAPGTVVDGF